MNRNRSLIFRVLVVGVLLGGAVLLILRGTLDPGVAPPPRAGPLPAIMINDNREPAGTLTDDVLTLELEIVEGDWRLLGEDQPAAQVLAFAERGQAPSIPGPLVRVAQGTQVLVIVSNPLDVAIVVHGLGARGAGLGPPLAVPAGETREIRFEADVPGTYYYWGANTDGPIDRRVFEDSQLTGALVVESGETVDDRILMIGVWSDTRLRDGGLDPAREFLVINGRSWPYTERLTYALGDSIRWRVINASWVTHSMHLHGFFYRIDARGTLARDTIYGPDQRRGAVTEDMVPGATMSMVWAPDRPGGWIFHCHIAAHFVPNPSMTERLSEEERFDPMYQDGRLDHDPDRHAEEGMGGLMMAMYIRPPEGWVSDEPKRRELKLFVQSAPAAGGLSGRQFAYVLQEGDAEPAPDSVRLPGSAIVLRRGEPTAITVFNRTDEPTQVHWHGLEIESYFDGVVGLGGYPQRLTPAIEPGESWEMRITPPRAGSFMYHTHVSDLRQQSSGLYGPFVILEDDEQWDPESDRVFIFGDTPFRDDGLPVLNGANPTESITFEAGRTYRLRFMQITLNRPSTRIRLLEDGAPVRWLPIAEDGFDLPDVQRRLVLADQTIAVGETFDFEYTPSTTGELLIEFTTRSGTVLVDQVVRVIERP